MMNAKFLSLKKYFRSWNENIVYFKTQKNKYKKAIAFYIHNRIRYMLHAWKTYSKMRGRLIRATAKCFSSWKMFTIRSRTKKRNRSALKKCFSNRAVDGDPNLDWKKLNDNEDVRKLKLERLNNPLMCNIEKEKRNENGHNHTCVERSHLSLQQSEESHCEESILLLFKEERELLSRQDFGAIGVRLFCSSISYNKHEKSNKSHMKEGKKSLASQNSPLWVPPKAFRRND